VLSSWLILHTSSCHRPFTGTREVQLLVASSSAASRARRCPQRYGSKDVIIIMYPSLIISIAGASSHSTLMSWDVTMKFSVRALRIQLFQATLSPSSLPFTPPSVRPQPAPQVDAQTKALCYVWLMSFAASSSNPLVTHCAHHRLAAVIDALQGTLNIDLLILLPLLSHLAGHC
jgi:hypothetical protein